MKKRKQGFYEENERGAETGGYRKGVQRGRHGWALGRFCIGAAAVSLLITACGGRQNAVQTGEPAAVQSEKQTGELAAEPDGGQTAAQSEEETRQQQPESPEKPENYIEEDCSVGYDEEHPLKGKLTLPADAGKAPVAILVPGSGAVSMDSPIGKAQNRPLADLAHGLAKRGVASLRWDKRSYEYPDQVKDIQTEYLWDVKAAIQWVKEDPRLDGSQIYLVGHSQGGMMGPLLVSENPEICGFVSLAGTPARLEDKMLEQAIVMEQQNGEITEAEREANIDAAKADVEQIKKLTGEAEASEERLIRGYPETYWKSINAMNGYELAEELAKKQFPMLILQGKNDFQVLYHEDFQLWKEALQEDGNAQFQAYEGLSHVFMPGTGARFDSSDYDTPAHMDDKVIEDVADWILDWYHKSPSFH